MIEEQMDNNTSFNGQQPPKENIWDKIKRFFSFFSSGNKFNKISLAILVVVLLVTPIIILQQTNILSHAGTSLFTTCTPIPRGLTQEQIHQLSGSGKVNWCKSRLGVSGVAQHPTQSAGLQQEDEQVGGSNQKSIITPVVGQTQASFSRPVSPPSPPPLGSVYHNVMFVGDSITAGWINDGADAYPILTIKGLYDHNNGNAWYQLIKGRSGAITAGALLDLKTFNIQPQNVNLMVVELGTNDIVHMNPDSFRTSYQELINYLLESSPDAQLVCLGPWRSAKDNFGYGSTPAYESVIQNICKTNTYNTAIYLDLSSLYANPAYHNTTGDTFHPNNLGSQAIANEIVNAVYPK